MKMHLLLMMILVIAAVPSWGDQALLTNRSDFLTVPNGNILGNGTLDLSVGSIGPDFVNEGNEEIFAVGLGIGSFEATVNGSLEDFDTDTMAISLKYQIDPGEVGLEGFGRTKAAIFLCNLGEGQVGIPGFAMTKSIVDRLDLSVSGWYNDGWVAGAALQCFVTDWLAPTVEYGTDDHWAYGVDLSSRWLYGRVVYLDDVDCWYATIGHIVSW
jgi:hypothetical protein